MIVSPDVGGVARARAIAQRLGADLAIVDKRRPRAGVSEVMNIIGDVARPRLHPDRRHRRLGRHAGERRRGPAQGRRHERRGLHHPRRPLATAPPSASPASKLKELVDHRLDRGEPDEVAAAKNIRRITIAPLIGEAIARTASEQSVSSLFD